eukprot:895700-Pelagomonas_calceolata.AAC.4
MQERDGQSPEVLVYTRMQVHTHNEQDCTLNKNDHTVAVNIQHCPHKQSKVHTIYMQYKPRGQSAGCSGTLNSNLLGKLGPHQKALESELDTASLGRGNQKQKRGSGWFGHAPGRPDSHCRRLAILPPRGYKVLAYSSRLWLIGW